MVTQLPAFVKTQGTTHLKRVSFTVYKLYLYKEEKKKVIQIYNTYGKNDIWTSWIYPKCTRVP